MSTAPAPSVTPEFAVGLCNVYLGQLRNEVATTSKVLKAVPEDASKQSYKPDPKAKSARELAWHIAGSDVHFLENIAACAFDFSEEGRTLNQSGVKTIAELAAWYEREMNRGLDAIAALPAHKLSTPVPFFHFNFPNVMYLMFATNHSVHHRGQLSTYLRPMGSKIPSIYGGSADEPMS